MTYDYKCNKCGKIEEINIPTYDIHTRTRNSLGIDPKKLSERINQKRDCECGGELKRMYTKLEYDKPLFVQVNKQRFL